MAAALIAAALVAYNSVMNLWPPFHGWAYVPVNLAMTALLVTLALGPGTSSPTEVGLDGGWEDAGAGAGLALLVASPLLGGLCSERGLRFLADRRVEGSSLRKIVYRAAVRIPFGTALVEEVAFRGVLFAMWASRGGFTAAVISSVAFGGWHIVPGLNLVRANRPDATFAARWTSVLAGVVLTAGAGFVLSWLRVETGSLAAPVAMHATVNSVTVIFAGAAHRRLQTRERLAVP